MASPGRHEAERAVQVRPDPQNLIRLIPAEGGKARAGTIGPKAAFLRKHRRRPAIATAFPITVYLGYAIGAYMVAAGLGGLATPRRWMGMIDSLSDSPGLAYVTGIVTFTIGVTIALLHDLWFDAFSVFITLIGWAAAIEGLILIAFPGPLLALARYFMPWVRLFALLSVVAGAVLIFCAYTAETYPVYI